MKDYDSAVAAAGYINNDDQQKENLPVVTEKSLKSKRKSKRN